MLLEDKVAIVTGAGNGLGEVYAGALADAGATVCVVDIDSSGAERVASLLRTRGAVASHFVVDVSDDGAVEDLARDVGEQFGRIDILVNNAGLLRDQYNECLDLPSEGWRKIMAVNVVAPVTCARACRPYLAAQSGSAIVNQSSMGAYAWLNSAYSVSKLALSGVTVALAEELSEDGIRVNGIAPGMMTGKIPDALVQSVIGQQMLKRRGKPEDLVETLLYLCSERSAFVTGQTVIVDGGVTRRP